MNGPATIYVNDKVVCRTNFSDHFEFIKNPDHPVGANNQITTDRAVFNCLLALATVICFMLTLVYQDLTPLWVTIGMLLYAAQLLEVYLSQTTKLLKYSASWDDLNVFREWFQELKKCRPMLKFTFKPTQEQASVLRELHTISIELQKSKERLEVVKKADRGVDVQSPVPLPVLANVLNTYVQMSDLVNSLVNHSEIQDVSTTRNKDPGFPPRCNTSINKIIPISFSASPAPLEEFRFDNGGAIGEIS